MRSFKILVVEDFEEFRRFVSSLLEPRAEFQVVFASDGLEGVQKAEELQPDLILLDIGLPRLNGIEAGRRIRKISPNSKILYISQESSTEVVQEAFRLGAQGYLFKSNAARELLVAVEAVLQGKQFVSRLFGSPAISTPPDEQRDNRPHSEEPSPLPAKKGETSPVHEVASYRNDVALVDDFARFVEAALTKENPIIVIATDTHRTNLQQRLQARGWDIASAVRQGIYVSLDASETLSTFMVNDWPDRARFLRVAGDLVIEATKAAKGERPRVAACGECAPMLWEQGKPYAAIQLEHLWDEIARKYDIDILCGYLLSDFRRRENSYIFERICAEHSAAYSL